MGFQIILLVAGFIMLYYGADWLVKGSANLARSLGITPVVIGLTVVAFGTSAPELVVSVVSSISEKSMIAVGNVVGSNICNIALVLGAAACIAPLKSDRSVLRRDIPLMIAISTYLLILSLDSTISRIEGVTLFVGVIVYIIFNYYVSTRQIQTAVPSPDIPVEAGPAAEVQEIDFIDSRPRQIVLIVAGIAGVVIGAQVLIDAAVVIMKNIGVSEKFVGLTIVALGTSLPELATSVVAALRKQMDISIGNLIGSNVFNILSVIGAAGMVRPVAIAGGFFESGLFIDYLVMMGISTLPWLLMRKNLIIGRSGGGILLCCYLGYIGYLVYGG